MASGAAQRQIITFTPLGINDLPAHPDLQTHQPNNPPTARAFLALVFAAAHAWDISAWPKNRRDHRQIIGGCEVVVERCGLKTDEGVWCGRRSRHVHGEPVREDELDDALRINHAEREREYADAVFDANVLVEWQEGGLEGEGGDGGVRWSDGTIQIVETFHELSKIGLPEARVFTMLLITGTIHAPTASELCVIQIPIDISSLPPTVLQRCHRHFPPTNSTTSMLYLSPTTPITPQQAAKTRAKLTEGRYLSIEKVRKSDSSGTASGSFEWHMSTISDAGGALPRPLQNLFVPHKITQDVGDVFEWILKSRAPT
ncbi:hypothetical protein BDV95DRAFT_217177 [Massariosphaeria phaeospora]|uniref:DUF3074 domain-containing protein n=1 Tax=Massariosphaeria phaeospora TaxID=100035 RepID=A0A7C8MF48_9PLEO|nr:hypothetical protein BDV95DRAFT_217177 [Massariosphaeria phaeospora]